MKTVTTREAQHHLSKVLDMVDNGENIVITRRGEKAYSLSLYEQEDICEKEVDWSAALSEIKERLGHLPKLKGSTVEMLRENERY